jgi:hypothetical protein
MPPKRDEDPVTWHDVVEILGEIRQLDARIGRLETGHEWVVRKMEEIGHEVHSLRWWVVSAVIGGTFLALVLRMLLGL